LRPKYQQKPAPHWDRDTVVHKKDVHKKDVHKKSVHENDVHKKTVPGRAEAICASIRAAAKNESVAGAKPAQEVPR